tara:strand:+ start:509 stop:1585 length:1077 start_codon:yes stop_codon:yes gene_type:complete
MRLWICSVVLMLLASCAGTDDLRGIAAKPPLDRAVLVSGGAFFSPLPGSEGTFILRELGAPAQPPDATKEAIPFAAILDVLDRGRVFQRVVGDTDEMRRRDLRQQLRLRSDETGVLEFLQQAREDGFDLLVLIEELRDGPIDNQGTNNRWPVTFATWILLGVGALIPDRTFESRATLRVSLRELQSGREIASFEVDSGPIELALTERTDVLGLLASIIVPPFWVGDDREAVAASVRATTERRLLLSLARKLKSEVFRRRLDDLAAADIQLVQSPEGTRVVVSSIESLSVVRIEGPGFQDAAVCDRFATELINSRDLQRIRFHYEALLPKPTADGSFQIRIGTLRGGVASATFTAESAR